MAASTNINEGLYLHIKLSDLPNRYAIYPDGVIRHLSSTGEGAANAAQFDRLVCEYMTLAHERALNGINRHEWADFERWYILDLLLSLKTKNKKAKNRFPRLQVYNSVEEAKKAQDKDKAGI